MNVGQVWPTFWALFVLVPLTIAWAFAVFDIFRRGDLSGWGKAAWFAAVIVLQGELTDQEFASAKARLLLTIGGRASQGAAAPTVQGVAGPTH
jgi:hypothetical protein